MMPRIILTLILFLGAIAGALFYLWPRANQYLAMRSDTGALERISSELDGAAEARDLLRSKINAVSSGDLERVGLVLPKNSDRESLIRAIDYYAAASGVFVKSINFETESAEASPAANSSVPRPGGAPEAENMRSKKEMGINLEAAGNYANMKRFLDALEKHIRIIDVETISFSAMKSPAEVFTFSIMAKTYYQ